MFIPQLVLTQPVEAAFLNLWEQAGKCHGKKIYISNSTQHMDECYSAWWDVQFLNLIQMSVYYSTTSPCEHSGFGWRLFPVQPLFLQHSLLPFLPAVHPLLALTLFRDLFHCLPFHFLCTNSVTWSSLWIKAKNRSSSSSIHNLKEYEVRMGENLPMSPFEQRFNNSLSHYTSVCQCQTTDQLQKQAFSFKTRY